MLKAHGKPFMTYYICHELWLSPKSTIPKLGFMICKVDNCCNVFWCGMNYRLGVLISRNGLQCGEFNAPWETRVSSPNLGLVRRYGSFVILLCELCSTLWSALWHEV